MNELVRTLVHGGNWTERERRLGRWVRNSLAVLLVLGAIAWNHHWQGLGAQHVVWTKWVSSQCQTGQREECMSYVDFARPSGMPAEKFWTSHPDQAATADCVERMGWVTLSIGRKDYAGLLDRCVRTQSGTQKLRTPQS